MCASCKGLCLFECISVLAVLLTLVLMPAHALLPVFSAVQAVYIKTNESVALPVYQVLPDQPTKIAAVQQQ